MWLNEKLKDEVGLRFCRVVRSLTDVTGMQDVIRDYVLSID